MIRRLFLLLLLAFGSFAASAQTAINSATLTWSAPTAYTDGSPIAEPLTFQVYQGLQGATKVKLGTPAAGTTRTISAGLLGGKTYCWQVSTVAASGESALSNEACKTFPAPLPQAPAALTVQ